MINREGVNCDIENWSVLQVLSWLKSTNDGQFDKFVPIFRDHEIYGDALLSLRDEILRDELGITAYGARHALLKAIKNLKQSHQSRQEIQSKLKNIKFNINRSQPHHQLIHQHNKIKIHKSHRKGSMSSVTSKASINTRTSHTYCVGDLQRDNSDTIAGIDDNWENLNTKAKLGVVDAKEYDKQAKLIVKACTGTTVKLTRKGSDDGCDNIYKSGFFEFEDNIPNWTTLDSQTAIKYEWNIRKLAWDKSYITVKIAENPFSRGSLRVSYYCLDLTEEVNNNSHLSKNNRFNHKSFDLTSLSRRDNTPKNNNSTTPKSLRSMKSPSAHSLIGHKSDKIAIQGYHSKSNGNLKSVAFQHQNLAQKAGSSPFHKNNNDKSKELESMSVPADVALGRHHHGLSSRDGDISPPVPNDNLPFPFFSPSLPEAEDEKIDSSQSQMEHDRHLLNEEKSMEEEKLNENEAESTSHVRMNIPILSPTPMGMGVHNNKSDNISTIEENEEKSRDSNNSHTFTANTIATIATISTKTNLQKDDLVSRLLGFESRYGGTLIVAKQSIDLTESVQTYFNDVRTQSVAQLFANEYNKYNPPKKVAFIKV